jgi:hypothetical protein
MKRYKAITPTTGGAALRGGNWNNGTNAGAFTLNLNNSSGDSNTNIGFRCVLVGVGRLGIKTGARSYKFIYGHLSKSLESQGTSALFLGPLGRSYFFLESEIHEEVK